MFGNVHVTFGQVLENLQKSSENRSEHPHWYTCIYIIIILIIIILIIIIIIIKRTLQVRAANE